MPVSRETIRELLARYARGERDFAGAQLTEANLVKADLSDADLSRAYLWGAKLSEANLSRAKFERAELPMRAVTLVGSPASGCRLDVPDVRA